MAKATIRKDALRSRRAILDAARKLLADGSEPSFAEIADAAGVGQATVYRHFEDRRDLLGALAEEAMTQLEERVAAKAVEAGSFERLLRSVAAEQARDRTLTVAIRRGELEPARVRRLTDRARALFREPLATAQAAGLVRPQLDLDDVMAVLAMLAGALAAAGDERQRGEAAARALDVLFDGLRPG
ncbi:MAG: helix-turn-helix transcriptional regulator [Actinobacteria bacterium]|nr:helix-turn-helix transcriptional regulator [Actinomycetota bacterium]